VPSCKFEFYENYLVSSFNVIAHAHTRSFLLHDALYYIAQYCYSNPVCLSLSLSVTFVSPD